MMVADILRVRTRTCSERAGAFRTYSLENKIVPQKPEPMAILDVFIQIGDILHIHVENPPTPQAFGMMVVVTEMVKTVGASRNFQIADFSVFRQLLQVSIHCSLADGRMFRSHGGIDLIRSGMAVQSPYCFQYQGTLNGIAFHYI